MNVLKEEFTTPWGVKIIAQGREDTNDHNTLVSCLEEDEYKILALPEGGIAVDIGAHIGGVSLALASRGYHVIALEMLAENMELLVENYGLNPLPGGSIRAIRAAVVGKPTKGTITAYHADTDSESGRVHQFIGTIMPDKYIADTKKHGTAIQVPTISLTEVLKNVEVCDFMKIDVEGSEWEIIKNTPAKVLKKIKVIAAEIEGLDGEVSTTDFLKLLPAGFVDASEEYFPKWCAPGNIIHGYFINKSL